MFKNLCNRNNPRFGFPITTTTNKKVPVVLLRNYSRYISEKMRNRKEFRAIYYKRAFLYCTLLPYYPGNKLGLFQFFSQNIGLFPGVLRFLLLSLSPNLGLFTGSAYSRGNTVFTY